LVLGLSNCGLAQELYTDQLRLVLDKAIERRESREFHVTARFYEDWVLGNETNPRAAQSAKEFEIRTAEANDQISLRESNQGSLLGQHVGVKEIGIVTDEIDECIAFDERPPISERIA